MIKKIWNNIIGPVLFGLFIGVIFGIGFLISDKEFVEEQESYKAEMESLFVAPVESTERTTTEETLVSLGVYTITHYCSCEICCGKSDGITASGSVATENHTIAASSEFPFGTVLVINGIEYTVEDRGGAITNQKVDIYCESHQEALNKGIYETEIFMKGEKQ